MYLMIYFRFTEVCVPVYVIVFVVVEFCLSYVGVGAKA